MKDKALTDGSIYFKTNSPDLLSDVNKLRNVITNDLRDIEVFFPNLYVGVSKLFQMI